MSEVNGLNENKYYILGPRAGTHHITYKVIEGRVFLGNH